MERVLEMSRAIFYDSWPKIHFPSVQDIPSEYLIMTLNPTEGVHRNNYKVIEQKNPTKCFSFRFKRFVFDRLYTHANIKGQIICIYSISNHVNFICFTACTIICHILYISQVYLILCVSLQPWAESQRKS